LSDYFRRRRTFFATCLCLLLAVTAAPAPAQDNKIKLAIASAAVVYAPIWIAMSENLFQKHGVDVELVSSNALSTGSAMIASGSADLLATTSFLGMHIANQGKPLSYVMNLTNMNAGINAVVARPSIKSFDQVAAMGSGCKTIVLPQGTATWAIYRGVESRYHLNCSVGTAGTVPLLVADALSGQFDVAVLNPQDAYAARDAGKVNILFDPLKTTPDVSRGIYPYVHPLSAVFGLKENVQQKRDAVQRFVGALKEANAIVCQRSPEALGQEISEKLPAVFGSTPVPALVLQFKVNKAFFPCGPRAGFISADEWNEMIKAAPVYWGFSTEDLAGPGVKYANVVDMSYFDSSK
jgi:ABC-type nitrate/sulfonate/bicarbonate transport system substrate-binding protein